MNNSRIPKPKISPLERIPTHRCKVCGALWILWQFKNEPALWSLGTNEKCGPCCDNVSMGDQIETLAEAYTSMRAKTVFPPQRQDPATWVLHLLVNDEISVNKAREWLRHYIQDGVQDPLPDVKALP